MSTRPEDFLPQPDAPPPESTRPLASAMYPTSVWICNDTRQADAIMAGQAAGYAYQRERHPNADAFVEKARQLHGAECGAATASGMAAIALAVMSFVQAGDHILYSDRLYGRTLRLLGDDARRLGIATTPVDVQDLAAVAAAMTPATCLVVAETIANPRLQVVDLAALAAIAHRGNARLLIDNTFATPLLCQPLRWGADLVMESVSKMMNGHSDVMLGLLLGKAADWERVPATMSTWGWASSPFDCWLAGRGLATLALRAERACANAQCAAAMLAGHPRVLGVDYPGLPAHPQHELARRQFGERYGSVVTFHLDGEWPAADRFLAGSGLLFCPSLGEACTTVSHPASTSHRGLSESQRRELGILGGTLRLSCGIESAEFVLAALERGLA